MAVSRDSTVLPRRTLLAGAAVAIAAAPVMIAIPTAAAPATGDPVFAAKREATAAAWAHLRALYADQPRRFELIGPDPALPERLLEPMYLPGSSVLTAAPKGGWAESYLAAIVRTGLDLSARFTEKGGVREVRTEWKPVSAKTRKQAAELLHIRKAYEAERNAWWEKITAIEKEAEAPLNTAIELALDLMAYPVSTLPEVREKLALADDYALFDVRDDEVGLLKSLLRDALAAAKKAVAHA